MFRKVVTFNVVVLMALLFSSCGKETPNRDHIPMIKASLLRLQNGVKDQNLAMIDSLLSPKILEKGQSSDSLVKYVYGQSFSFAFEQFGIPEIVYGFEKGRIDCFVMDSTHTKDRPLVLYLALEHDMWLFTSFSVGENSTDSLTAE